MQRGLGSWAGTVCSVIQTQRVRAGGVQRARDASQQLFLRDTYHRASLFEAPGCSMSCGAPRPGVFGVTSRRAVCAGGSGEGLRFALDWAGQVG